MQKPPRLLLAAAALRCFVLAADGDSVYIWTLDSIVSASISPTGFREILMTRFYLLLLSGLLLSNQLAVASQTLIDFESNWSYFKGTVEAAATWRGTSYNDESWPSGPAPFRYGTGTGGTILADMQGSYSSVFLRQRFRISDPNSVPELAVKVNYDDAFIVWINGVEAARSANAPAAVAYNAVASGSHLSGTSEEFPLQTTLVAAGINVIAVQFFNVAANSPEAFFDLELKIKGEQVGDTHFNVKRGFYDTPFQLDITCVTPGASIRYTSDGTTPTSTSGQLFSGPITIDKTSWIKAVAFAPGMISSNIDTHTYIFVADVVTQSPTAAPPGWPASWTPNATSYGMDPTIVNGAEWNPDVVDGLKSLPAISMVVNIPDLFGPNGNYSRASSEGLAWERPVSIERIDPNGDIDKQFQSYAGMRIRGATTTNGSNPKHSFRIIYRNEYGSGKLNYKLFGPGSADRSNEFDLMCQLSFSWYNTSPSYPLTARRAHFNADLFSRDCESDIGIPSTRGDWHNVFINGQYWGIYCTEERPDASYAEEYFGGPKENWDVVKVGSGWSIYAADGTMDAWGRLWSQCNAGLASDAAYQRIQGRNPDGTVNPAYENLLEVDTLIDDMLIVYFMGNKDGPISHYLTNNGPNNWIGLYDRTGQHGGFRFLLHDCEASLLSPDSPNVNEDRIGPAGSFFTAGDNNQPKSSPQWVFGKCAANAEFRLKVADHIQKHFFNDGALTPNKTWERFSRRTDEIFKAMADETARWGDCRITPACTRNDWMTQVVAHRDTYFPVRTGIVFNQLSSRGLYPNVPPPAFNHYGGNIPANFTLAISNPNGTGTSLIYYTLDGTDPRIIGGAVSPTAVSGGQSSVNVSLPSTMTVKARVLDNGNWSAMLNYTFFGGQDLSMLKITEIMYNPLPGQSEFIELKNTGAEPLNLTKVLFDSGVTYAFPEGTVLGPGEFKVLVSETAAFTAQYPGVAISGVYAGSLANSGENLILSLGTTPIFSVKYGDSAPWPNMADGEGFSVVPVNPNINPDPNLAANWRASSNLGGSPGADDPSALIEQIVINEVLSRSTPLENFIELYNPTAAPVNIGGWFLSDSSSSPKKFRIPDSTIIAADDYVVFNNSEFNPTPPTSENFALNPLGGKVYLFSGDLAGNLSGYSCLADYEPAENNVSFGRYVISTGESQYPAQVSHTRDALNAGPRIGPLVISEINYNPGLFEGTPGDEFVEIFNTSANTVPLYDPNNPANTWQLSGLSFNFPPNAQIASNGTVVVCATDPETFRTRYNVPGPVQIFGPFAGTLQNNGELLALKKPDAPTVDGLGNPVVPYITVDAVRYSNKAPWPTTPDGSGPSLVRVEIDQYGNDPVNWKPSPDSGGSPGRLDGLTPLAPIALTSVSISDARVTLEWTDQSSTEEGFKIERSASGLAPWTDAGSVGANIVSSICGGLQGATDYYFRVYAFNNFGPSNYSNVVKITTDDPPPPADPENLAADAASAFAIDLSWSSGDNREDGFYIERSLDGANGWAQVLDTAAGITTAQDTNLDPNTVYFYRVQSFSVWSESVGYSNVASALTDPPPPPNKPANLSAATISFSAIALTWNDNSPNETGFRIQRSLDGENWADLVNAPQNSGASASFTDLTCDGATKYYYRVSAFHDFGESDFSNSANALTSQPPIPTAPKSLAAVAEAFNRILLTWVDTSNVEAAFRIERSTDGVTAWGKIASVSSNVTQYADRGVAPLSHYYYRVIAYHAYGQSPNSNVANALTPAPTPPATPENFAGAADGLFAINLSWDDASDNESGFIVERSPDGIDGWNVVGESPEDAESFHDTNLATDTLYFYRVSAVHEYSVSPHSDVIGVRTAIELPDAPTFLIAAAASDTQINLTWTASARAAGYSVQRSPNGSANWNTVGAATVPAYSDSGLARITTYFYRVFATNASGASPNSSVASATTFSASGPDFDVDSFTDYDELHQHGTNPNNADSKPGGTADFDHDGLTDDSDPDDDNDGVSTPDEVAAETNPFDAVSYPSIAMQISKLQLKANFKKPGSDSCAATGALPAQFALNNTVVKFNVGGAEEVFTVDAKGKGVSGHGSIAFAANKKSPGTTAFSVKISKQNWVEFWNDEGFDPAAGKTKSTISFKVELRLAGKVYAATVRGVYSNGTFKGPLK